MPSTYVKPGAPIETSFLKIFIVVVFISALMEANATNGGWNELYATYIMSVN